MSLDADFERFARDSAAGFILGLRKMGGNTFTEADRRAMVNGLDVLRTAIVQPVGPSASDRVPGAVSHLDVNRALIMVACSAMQLWSSGKLDEVEVDDGD